MSLSEQPASPDAIVLLHGWAGHPAQYETTAKAIEDLTGIRVVTPLLPVVTAPGDRWRPTPALTATIPGCAKELEPTLPAGRIALVGHSLGGGVAIALAHRIINRLDSLTLVSSVGGDPGFTWRSWADMVAGSQDEAVTNAEWDTAVRKAALSTVARHPIATTRMAIRGKQSDLRRPLHRIVQAGVPVSLVIPDDDRIVNTGRLVKVPGVVVRRVPGNHGWVINEPEAVAREMSDLLQARTGRPTT